MCAPQTEMVSNKTRIFTRRPLNWLLLDITLLSSRRDKVPFTLVDLVLVSQLLYRHQHIVTGAQMSVETAGGQSERASQNERSYLFMCLFIYFLCHCHVV